MTPEEFATQKLASELQDLLEIHAPHLIVGRRYTNGLWYITVKKRIVEQPTAQIQLFEDKDFYGTKMIAEK